MQDTKDILGVRGAAPAGGTDGPPAVKAKPQKQKRPEGMSREAFALLGDSHPIMSAQELMPKKKKDIKAKPKPSTKGIVTWRYLPFKSSARSDGLELQRWTKSYKDAAGRFKEPDDSDYYFAKFNKKVRVPFSLCLCNMNCSGLCQNVSLFLCACLSLDVHVYVHVCARARARARVCVCVRCLISSSLLQFLF
jgi:hypothetical protein